MERVHGLEIPGTLDEVCDPARLALVVYDMRVGVLSQIQGACELIGRSLLRQKADS